MVNREVGVVELCNSRLTPSPCFTIFLVLPDLNLQEDDAKFFGFSKAEDGPSQAGRLSQTFPEEPIEFRVLCGTQESRPFVPQGLGILGS